MITAGGANDMRRLAALDAAATNISSGEVLDLQHLEDSFFGKDEQEASGRVGIARRMALIQLRTSGSAREDLEVTVAGARQALLDVQLTGTNDSAFPDAEVYAVTRSAALAMRYKLPSICLRLQNDPGLRERGPSSWLPSDIDRDQYTPFFGSSHALVDGIYIFECYIAPLMGSMAPFLWGFPAARGEVTVIYTFGRALAGTDGLPTEPLQAISFRGSKQAVETPIITAIGIGEAIAWWFQKLDDLLAAVSDPAIHTDQRGDYRPSKHLNSLLSVEQLFRRVAVVQRSHRDIDARRLALFSVLDTLQRLTGRDITVLCRISTAEKTLLSLEASIPEAAQEVLLPACRRAVKALREVQEGFFLPRQSSASSVGYVNDNGKAVSLTYSEAAAQYIKLLRNATHGFGDIVNRRRSEALLVQHSGHVPDDLAFLSWLYLLDLMNNPARLRLSLWGKGAS